ncbi:YlzJ-like family protein [Neobacillus sp. 3P2-tot-E-2]|uniref:YlzJ-like family protein n=1 Tax=Neobacillus sp. 3P2-tot-E-2 TaxID=3132212 RepID=UPI0039A2EFC3
MILYTTMPQEFIYPPKTEAFTKQQTVTYQGVSLIVEQMDLQNVQVVRILSSDPQHYLDERICPGAKISCASIEGMSAN